MADLTQMSDTDLHQAYNEYSAEINRRHELQRIPDQITELATQGRNAGIDDQTMVEAVIHIRDPEDI